MQKNFARSVFDRAARARDRIFAPLDSL